MSTIGHTKRAGAASLCMVVMIGSGGTGERPYRSSEEIPVLCCADQPESIDQRDRAEALGNRRYARYRPD